MTTQVQGTGIVVGVDGSAASDAALDWALAEAELRGQPLEVLRAEDPLAQPAVALTATLPHVTAGTAQVRLAELAEEALDKARARTGLVGAATVAGVVDSPRAALVDATDTAALVVVGRRGAGRLRHLLLGSVAGAVVHHARGPVAVVPERWSGAGRRVLVGYDGSGSARSALRLAAVEAERRGAVLEVLFAWQVMTLLPALAPEPGYVPPLADCEALAGRVLDAARAEVASGGARPEVTTRAVHRAPAAALLDAATDADLVVVGARGTGGFADLLLGSVSTALARHASCPVLVVRKGEERLPRSEPEAGRA